MIKIISNSKLILICAIYYKSIFDAWNFFSEHQFSQCFYRGLVTSACNSEMSWLVREQIKRLRIANCDPLFEVSDLWGPKNKIFSLSRIFMIHAKRMISKSRACYVLTSLKFRGYTNTATSSLSLLYWWQNHKHFSLVAS